jgi:hypothetical protein
VDRALAASQYWLVVLAAYAGVSVLARARSVSAFAMALTALGVPLLFALGMRSRTMMVVLVLAMLLAWLTIRPDRPVAALSAAVAMVLTLFALGTIVKASSDTSQSIAANLAAVRGAGQERILEENRRSLDIDWQYRLAGLELPAAILMCQFDGVPPMYGRGALDGITSSLPSFIRPDEEVSERLAILRQYRGCLTYSDSIGIPLSSGLADFGRPGAAVIYAVMALFCAALWRVVQRSPRLYVAYLMCGITVGDLFWENAFLAVKSLAWSWAILVLFGPLLMPKWRPAEPSLRAQAQAGPLPSRKLWSAVASAGPVR